jgi:hypothetical protein
MASHTGLSPVLLQLSVLVLVLVLVFLPSTWRAVTIACPLLESITEILMNVDELAGVPDFS